MEEMARIVGTTQERAWCLPALSELMLRKAIGEEELQVLDKQKEIAEGPAMTTEFLVTKTVSNKEVWDHLPDWEQSVRTCAGGI